MSKKIRHSKDERKERLTEVLIPFKRKKSDNNGFYYWIGQERYLIPEELVGKIKELLAEFKKEDIIQQEGYHRTAPDNVSITLPEDYIRFILKFFGY